LSFQETIPSIFDNFDVLQIRKILKDGVNHE